MNREEIFVKELSQLVRLGKTQGNQVTSEQIKEAFVESEVAEDKLSFINEYLENNKIKIDDSFDPDLFMDETDKSYLDIYMEELAELPSVNDSEKEALIIKAMEDDKDAQMKLAEIYLPKVVEIAKLYVGQSALLEDLICEGNVALIAATNMMSCVEDAKDADGYVANIVMDAMEVLISGENDVQYADEKVLERVNQVAKAAEELYKDLRRKVTPEELANETDFTVDEIIQACKWTGNQIDTIEIGEDDADN